MMTQKMIDLTEKNSHFSFLPTGDLAEIESHGMMINQLMGNYLDGSLTQLYLRVYQEETILFAPMIGSNAHSQFFQKENQLVWKGQFAGVSYQVDFQLANTGLWFWQVNLQGTGQQADVIYGQDLGNALPGAVRSNEAYMSQYLDHHITQVDDKLVISSRQNQIQGENYPLVEVGSLTNAVAFSTDGYQFFGQSYKETNQPEALNQPFLANEVYQYEFAYVALQSEKITVTQEKQTIIFYGGTLANQATAVTKPAFSKAEVVASYHSLTFDHSFMGTEGKQVTKHLGEPIVGETMTKEEILKYFPVKEQVEQENQQLLSFFTTNYHHVVTKAKERAMERTHGHILLSGTELDVDRPLLSTTVYMPGIFNSQVVLGNTTMNKLMSNSRNALNVIKESGQRIYLKQGENWRILTMPSLFEMGLNSAKWYYKLEDDLLTITTYTVVDGREIRTEIHSQKGKNYTFAIANQLVMGADEAQPTYQLEQNKQVVTVTGSEQSDTQQTYPNLAYRFTLDQPFQLTDESLFFASPNNDQKLTIFLIENQAEVTVKIEGSLTGEFKEAKATTLAEQDQQYTEYINELLNNFELVHETQTVEQMNLIARWYTHNMLVHYLSPHGLEQYGGAAWGTRDVSQGPTEFFFAVNRPEVVASIIKKVYANQFSDDGNWPQWFMFDRYETQKADESHGDVIVWPMKVVADYLDKTSDWGILNEKITYTDRKTFLKTNEAETLLNHIKKEISYIESHFLPGTALSCYGDGDWDDTLQPFDNQLKKSMASSWTVALTYQVLHKLSILLREVDQSYSQHLSELVAKIKQDYETYMFTTDTLPGFVRMDAQNEVELMIHPNDQKTGIHYRLLPMTRGMIAELLTPKQAEHHLAIIKKHLQFPDGVRLMNRPAAYQGGVSTNFKRAEQSANFGREIGLQYVHAHIRFTEAMAKLGKTEETWHALNIINPIGITNQVKHAKLRQANVYFSSSDGDFKTRYEAESNFGKLKDGSVPVKGGWRIYSSGPGIYLGQLISSVLGIRETSQSVTFDPVLPTELDQLSLRYQLLGKPVTIHYHLGSGESKVMLNQQELPVEHEKNPYRTGGLKVSNQAIIAQLQATNRIDIYC